MFVSNYYKPPKKILKKYADVLVNFALGSGKGFKKGEVVRLVASESAKPLYAELRKAILKAGGHMISKYIPDDTKELNLSRDFYKLASQEQLEFFPKKYIRGLVDQIDHSVAIISETYKLALEGIDPEKIMTTAQAMKPFKEWLDEKEDKGKFTWTYALYATPEMARYANLSLKEFWQQIIKGCFLDFDQPISKWQSVFKKIELYRKKLNSLPIDKLHIEGEGINLWVRLGKKRKWAGGSGRNIPSFEIFTSPDWRGTNGRIKFNQPLFRDLHLVKDIELEFKNGIVVSAKASRNEKYLKKMIKTPGADKIGEFSLTDARFSKIDKFMAGTLYDENFGGRYGNTHIALGKSFHDCYDGDPTKVSKKKRQTLGFNDSAIHCDIVSTTKRTVTAYLRDGSKKVIYKNGKFTF